MSARRWRQSPHVRIGHGELRCELCEKREPLFDTPRSADETIAFMEKFNAEHANCEPNLRKILDRVKAAVAATQAGDELLVSGGDLTFVIMMADQFIRIDEQGQWLCGLMWDIGVSHLDAERYRACVGCGLKTIPKAEFAEHMLRCDLHPSTQHLRTMQARIESLEAQLAATSLSLHQATEEK